MKVKKICNKSKAEIPKRIEIPSMNLPSVERNQPHKNFNAVVNTSLSTNYWNSQDSARKQKRKSRPRKFIYTNLGTNPVPAYSEYKLLKLREKYRHKQVEFVEGNFPGIKLSILGFETNITSRDFK